MKFAEVVESFASAIETISSKCTHEYINENKLSECMQTIIPDRCVLSETATFEE